MRQVHTIRLYLIRLFVPAFIAALTLFTLSLELVELFRNLWRYLAMGAALSEIAGLMALYLPYGLSNALPISLLFAVTFSLGSLYADNELSVIFGSGISLMQFLAPLFVIATLLSIGSFFFDDLLVLPTIKAKNDLSASILKQATSKSNADVAAISREGSVLYRADYYDDTSSTLSGVTIIERNQAGNPIARIEAATARWEGGKWQFNRVRRFTAGEQGAWTENDFGTWSSDQLDESPEVFKSQDRDLKEMSVSDLGIYVAFLRRAGLPFAEALAERHKRFSFSFTPLVVVLLAGALGGRFRKNVLLASLLASLLAATAFYIAQMIAMLFAKTGALDPLIGAWAPLVAFAVVGTLLFRNART